MQAVRQRVAAAAQRVGRDPQQVMLLAVSKTFDANAVRAAYAAGQRAFGENYLQEALDKMAALAELPLQWHFIGPIQSNKTRLIAERFDWVHSIEREKIARRLADARPRGRTPLNVCIQVNVSGETSKSGAAPSAVQELAQRVQGLPSLKLRGLMAIPEPSDDPGLQRARFAQLRVLQQQLQATGLELDTLSMGMSQDLEAAIAEGATIVRIGTAIFGERSRA